MTYDSSFLIQSQMVKVEYPPVFLENKCLFFRLSDTNALKSIYMS